MKYDNFSNLPEFNMILQSAYLNLFHGATPDIMEAILDAYRHGYSFHAMHAIICTRPPCRLCTTMLLATNIQTIFTSDQWPDRDNAKIRWLEAKREWHTFYFNRLTKP